MSNILVITFPDETQGMSVLTSLKSLKQQNLLGLDDAAVIVKNQEGKVEIKNMVESGVKVGALSGGLLGLVVGTVLFPVAAIALGALAGGLIGKTFETGVDKKFITDVKESLTPGTSAILFIVKHENTGVLIAALEPYNGTIYQTSFDSEVEAEIRKALK